MNSIQRQVVLVAFGFVIVGILVWFIGFDDVMSRLQAADISLVLLGLIAYIASWPVRVFRMSRCLDVFESRIDSWPLFEINIAGYGLNMVLPAKLGDVARILYLVDEGVTNSAALATVIFVRIADMVAVSILVIVALGLLDVPILPSWLRQLIVVIGLFISSIGVLTLLTRYAKRSEAVSGIIGALFELIERQIVRGAFDAGRRTAADFDRLAFSQRTFLFAGTASVFIWVLEALTAFIIAGAFGAQVSFTLVLFAVSIANLSKIVPFTPAGLGVYEAAFTGVLAIFGIESALALTVGLVEHNLKNLFNIGVGIPMATKLGSNTVMELWRG